MANYSRVMIWLPRIFGVLLVLFLIYYSIHTLGQQATFGSKVVYLTKVILPALAVALAIYLGWSHPLIGGLLLILFGLIYVILNLDSYGWILGVSLPLLVDGILFLASNRHYRNRQKRKGRT